MSSTERLHRVRQAFLHALKRTANVYKRNIFSIRNDKTIRAASEAGSDLLCFQLQVFSMRGRLKLVRNHKILLILE